MASLLMSMAKPSGDREDRFLKDVEALCGSDEFRRRKVGKESNAQLAASLRRQVNEAFTD